MKHSISKTFSKMLHHMPINTPFSVLNNSVFTNVSVTSLKKNSALTLLYLADQKLLEAVFLLTKAYDRDYARVWN